MKLFKFTKIICGSTFAAITCPIVLTWNDKEANTTQRHVGAVVSVTSTKHADEGTMLLISRCMPDGEWEPSLGKYKTGVYIPFISNLLCISSICFTYSICYFCLDEKLT